MTLLSPWGNCARSALSQFIIWRKHQLIRSHPWAIRFMIGIYNLHPPIPRYMDAWDVEALLKVLRILLQKFKTQYLNKHDFHVLYVEKGSFIPLVFNLHRNCQIFMITFDFIFNTVSVSCIFRKFIFWWNYDHDTPLCDTSPLEDIPLCEWHPTNYSLEKRKKKDSFNLKCFPTTSSQSGNQHFFSIWHSRGPLVYEDGYHFIKIQVIRLAFQDQTVYRCIHCLGVQSM